MAIIWLEEVNLHNLKQEIGFLSIAGWLKRLKPPKYFEGVNKDITRALCDSSARKKLCISLKLFISPLLKPQ